MENKKELRKKTKAARDAVPKEIRRKKSGSIIKMILETSWFHDAKNILVYSAIGSEVTLDILYPLAWEKNKQLFFPKVNGKQMDFYKIHSQKQLTAGAFSVMEPDTGHYPLKRFDADIFVQEQSVMLLPGVAFSPDGYRIGYGGGYYDRFLAMHQNLYTVGIAYHEQMVEKIPAEVHDYRLDEIITDKECINCKIGGYK